MKLYQKFLPLLVTLSVVLFLAPIHAQAIGIPDDVSFVTDIPELSIGEDSSESIVLSDPTGVVYDPGSGILSWSLEAPAVTDHGFFIRLYDTSQLIGSFAVGLNTPLVPDRNGVYSYQYFLWDTLPDGTYYFDVCNIPSASYTATHIPIRSQSGLAQSLEQIKNLFPQFLRCVQ